MPFKHETIKDIGLEAYLDSPRQLQKHDGKGYADFVAMYNNGKGAPKAKIKREMHVISPNTIVNWIAIYEEEKKKNQ